MLYERRFGCHNRCGWQDPGVFSWWDPQVFTSQPTCAPQSHPSFGFFGGDYSSFFVDFVLLLLLSSFLFIKSPFSSIQLSVKSTISCCLCHILMQQEPDRMQSGKYPLAEHLHQRTGGCFLWSPKLRK